MNREFNKKIQLMLVSVIAVGLFISLSFKGISEEQPYSQNNSGAQKLIMIIFDFSSFSCPLCLKIFNDFCDTLHSCGQEELALGVLVPRDSENNEDNEKFKKIAEKQLRGLIIGNNLRFPFILDKFHIFEEMDLDGTTIILFDGTRKLLKKYKLPLTSEQREEVFTFEAQ